MQRILITDEKYDGKYVALKNQDDPTIVGAGKNPEEALIDAKKKGFLKPYLIYVPAKVMSKIN